MILQVIWIEWFTGRLRPLETSTQTASDAVGHRKHAIGHIVKKSRAGAAMQFIGTSFGGCFVQLSASSGILSPRACWNTIDCYSLDRFGILWRPIRSLHIESLAQVYISVQ